MSYLEVWDDFAEGKERNEKIWGSVVKTKKKKKRWNILTFFNF